MKATSLLTVLTGVTLASLVSSNVVGAAAVSAASMTGEEVAAAVRTAEAAPPAPSGLRAAVYSSTAGELFWDRPATFGLVYEVRRDGGTPVTTDGVSHYDDTLVPGASHDYEVVAIDRDGRRSAPASVTLAGDGGGTVTPPPSAGLAAPTGLRATRYSSRSGELFWDRPATFGLVYEVRRDGGTPRTTDGVSHYDDALVPGASHDYEVVAIDRDGRRSAPASVTLAGDGGGAVTPPPVAAALEEPSGYYARDGYGSVDVLRVNVRTATTPGTCTPEDLSGCTFDDVLADIDGSDDFTVEIPVHFRADDFADDGSVANAELRQRGASSRLAPLKSFRIKLDSKEVLWRGERRLQLNKHPYDSSRIRNKLAFDLMSEIPHLPSARTQFVNLWIDDGEGPVDHGIYTHIEALTKEYLVNRGWDPDDNVYKAETFLFSSADLPFLALDEEGEPLDEDAFESRLEIKSGEEHSMLLEMIAAVSDRERSFESVLDRYFDAENVLTWVTLKFLLHQTDAVTHNFYLYNPRGSEKFYFLPWDWDLAFDFEPVPENTLDPEALERRLAFGYGRGRASVFLSRYYRLPGIHAAILAMADELRRDVLSDAAIAERAARYTAVVKPVAGHVPDRPTWSEGRSTRFAEHVRDSHDAMRAHYGIPMPPRLAEPVIDERRVGFRWNGAFDVTGHDLSYELEVASSPDFAADTVLLRIEGIVDERSWVEYDVDVERIGSGRRYVRLFARSVADPARFWQIASNRPEIDGQTRFGVREFVVP